MAASLPNSPNAQTVQGPDPTGQLGYPVAVVGAPGGEPVNVNVIAGGGGAVTIADGADVAEGTTTDAAVVTDSAGTVSGKLRGIVKILANVWDSVNGWLKVNIQNASLAVTQVTSPWVVSGSVGTTRTIVRISASYTRPNNTTAYTSSDVISDSTSAPSVLTFSNAASSSGGSGVIRSVVFTSNANTATAALILLLFDTAPAAMNDNAVLTLSDSEILNIVGIMGSIPLSIVTNTGAGAAGNMTGFCPGAVNSGTNCTIPFVTNGSANLFGILLAGTGFTPVANQKFDIMLTIEQN